MLGKEKRRKLYKDTGNNPACYVPAPNWLLDAKAKSLTNDQTIRTPQPACANQTYEDQDNMSI